MASLDGSASGPARRWIAALGGPHAYRFPLAMILVFAGFALVPPIRGNPRLVGTYLGVGGLLLSWWAWLAWRGRISGHGPRVDFAAVRSHWIQACVQASIYVYFGAYWSRIPHQAPQILSQVFFLYALNFLLAWTRGRDVRLGFGVLPIIGSTNLFMWFRDDWFGLQFLLVATGALGKEFIQWERDGRRVHVFNPSSFGLSLFSVVLIATGTTSYTWGEELASLLALPPRIYLLLFVGGLVVQYFFSVTLMTFSAAATLCLLNLAYTGTTGVYHFIDSNIPIAVFLGLHLSVTDPSTSPRTNLGRVAFGALYGIANFLLYSMLAEIGAPEFYDKLLPVPILNLMVPWIDRWTRAGAFGRFETWQARWPATRWNLVHMAAWTALFAAMHATGFVGPHHPGEDVAFWKKAVASGIPQAPSKLLRLLHYQAEAGSPSAWNDLGVLHAEGRFLPRDPGAATQAFARASELGSPEGAGNLANLALFHGAPVPDAALNRAFDLLARSAASDTNATAAYLVARAHEIGRGRPLDKAAARRLYGVASDFGHGQAVKALARMELAGEGGPKHPGLAADRLQRACEARDGESCYFLAQMHYDGRGVRRDPRKAVEYLNKACQLGFQEACATLRSAPDPAQRR